MAAGLSLGIHGLNDRVASTGRPQQLGCRIKGFFTLKENSEEVTECIDCGELVRKGRM